MRRYLGKFYKTDHFLYRQWDRQIHDNILRVILNAIPRKENETLYIISKKVLRKINKNIKTDLFIKIKDKTLITCFYCNFQEYRNFKLNQEYCIINKI